MLINDIQESVRTILLELVESRGYREYAGAYSQRLEAALAERLTVSNCLLTSSGTAALEIALRATGIGPGDEVVLSAYDYPGNFWAIERVGATPVLVDTDAMSWQVSAEQVGDALRASRQCKALIVSHLHGQLQDTPELRRICEAHGVLFVEDCCQAVGASIDGAVAGTFGNAAILSFGGGKLLSAGRGGALLTPDERLFQRARLAAGAGSGPYAMSEVQAALALAQLEWLDQMNAECCRYFSDVVRKLQVALTGSKVCLEVPYKNELRELRTSIYQAGCLLSSVDKPNRGTKGQQVGFEQSPNIAAQRQRILENLQGRAEAGLSVGHGFPGFHRRSARRCRLAFELANAPEIAASTMVIHHRVALQQKINPDELSQMIATASNDVPG